MYHEHASTDVHVIHVYTFLFINKQNNTGKITMYNTSSNDNYCLENKNKYVCNLIVVHVHVCLSDVLYKCMYNV